MLGLDARKRLGKGIGDHILGRTKDEADRAILDDPANEVVANIDVFGMGVILVVFGKCDSRFVVGEKSGGRESETEDFRGERTKPECFFRSMGSSNVLPLGRRQHDELLLFRIPRDGAAVDEKRVPGDRTTILLLTAISIYPTCKIFIPLPISKPEVARTLQMRLVMRVKSGKK
jgi:hypothetical protein